MIFLPPAQPSNSRSTRLPLPAT